MIRFSVGEVVEAGLCPRRFVLRRAGAAETRPRGTPVGALVHETMRRFVERAPGDPSLREALLGERPSPEAVHHAASALLDQLLVERVLPDLPRFDGDEVRRAARTVRELGRLVATAIRRARVAGAPADQAVRRTLVAAERAFVLPVATPDGEAEIAGRFDVLVRNEVDDRLEVWELKTHAAESAAADEQATLYAFAVSAAETARPAVLQLAGDGQVILRAVALPDPSRRRALGERIAAMARWEAAPDQAPPTDERSHCVTCPLREACWERHGPTLGPPRAAEVLIGHDSDGGELRWAPNREEQPLANFGLLVTGDTGSGKTQTIRAVIAELRAAGLPVLVFDFKNDYGDPAFTTAAGLRLHDVREEGLPWSPLTLIPEGGVVRPVEQAHQVAAILARALGLGVQQEGALRRGILDGYRARGLGEAVVRAASPVEGPSFAEVVAMVDHPTLRVRLEPLSELGLLRAGDGDLGRLLGGGLVLGMHRVVAERLKDALAELSLLALHGFLLAGPQPRRMTRLLVIDEAHRVAGSEVLVRLLREGRAFGAGFALATQYPGDLSDEVQGALATKLFLRNDQEAHRAAVARQLTGAATVEMKRALRDLGPLCGFLVNGHYRPFRQVKVVPHYARGPAA